MTLDEFIKKYTGKLVEVAGSANAKNQCVDLANAYIKEVFNQPIIEWANAVDFPYKLSEKYTFVKNTPAGVPLPGSVIVFQKFGSLYGAPGHIGIVEEANVNKISVFEQNYPTGSACKIGVHDYRGCVGWFFLKDTQSQQISSLKYTEEEMAAVRTERDKNWNLYQEEQNKNQNLISQNNLLTEKNQQLSEELLKEKSGADVDKNELDRFIADIAKILTLPEDKKQIIENLPAFAQARDTVNSFKDKFERESKSHQEDLANSRDQLKALSEEIADMKEKHAAEVRDLNIQHQKQLDYVQQRVDSAIAEKEALEKQVRQSQTFTQALDYLKSLFSKEKRSEKQPKRKQSRFMKFISGGK